FSPGGRIRLPLIAAISNARRIGWAKPVPVSTRNLRNPRRDFMFVAAAGPLSNILQAVVYALIIRAFRIPLDATSSPLQYGLLIAVQINLLLAFFNLIPVPPLDGGNVMLGLLPPRAAATYGQLRQY